MTQVFIGHRPGYGPALRILKSDADDPIATPASAYEKFIFDSETRKLGYLNRLKHIKWDDNLSMPSKTGAGNGITTFYPPGSGMNDFEYAEGRTRAGDSSNNEQVFMWSVDSMGFAGVSGVKYYNGINGRITEARNDYVATDWGSAGDIRQVGIWRSYGARSAIVASSSIYYPYIPGHGYGSRPLLSATIRYGSRNEGQSILFEWKLPDGNVPYPFQDGVPVSGQEIMRIGDSMARMARPGFTVTDPDPNNFIFHEDQNPAKLIGVGSIEIPAGATVSVATVLPPTATTYVDSVLSSDGTTFAKPMPAPFGSSQSDNYKLEYMPTASGVDFINSGKKKIWANYMIFADDGRGKTTGGVRVESSDNGYFQIKCPGSSDIDPSYADILVDSRLPVPMLVSEGYIAWDNMTPVANQRHLGSRRHTVNVPNAVGRYKLLPVFSSPYHGLLRAYFTGRTYDGWAAKGSKLAVVQADRVDFWLANDHPSSLTLSGGAIHDTIPPPGIRYFVFAIPLSL